MRATLMLIAAFGPICLLAKFPIEHTTVASTSEESMQPLRELKPSQHAPYNKCPWIPDGFVYAPSALGLHTEIERFYEYMRPTRTERALRERVLARIESMVLQLWPQAQVELFGSSINGLVLPTSDIDIMIGRVSDPSRLRLLAAKLLANDIPEPDSMVVRDKARVPIIDFVDRESGIGIDISFDRNMNLLMSEFLDERKYSAYLKLMFVLKQLLKQRDLNDRAIGGITSYATGLMCINFLQLYADTKVNENLNFGDLLLGFLELYGRKFNYETTGISVRNGGKHLPRNELPCGLIKGQKQLFCIDNPKWYIVNKTVAVDPNAGTKTYRASEVIKAFDDAYVSLSQAISTMKNATTGDCEHNSILSHIFNASDHFVSYRKWVHDTFEHSPSTEKVETNLVSLPFHKMYI